MNVQQFNMDSQLVDNKTVRIGFTGPGKMADLYTIRLEYVLKQEYYMDLHDLMHSVVIPVRSMLIMGNDGIIRREMSPNAEHYLHVNAIKEKDAWLQVDMGSECELKFAKVFTATARTNIHKKTERRSMSIRNRSVFAF